MRRSFLVFLSASALLVALFFLWGKWRPTQAYGFSTGAARTPGIGSSPVNPLRPLEQQINPATYTREELMAEVRKRDAADQKWEWKIPIRFYGKAVDESERPIADADVHFQWTNLSARGTTDANVKSDGNGRFSLDNVEGKRLVVRVSKPGYYSSDIRNRLSYEYANPFEEIFHQPNPDQPAIFHLRKQGPAADLFKKSAEIILPGDGTGAGVNLETGRVDANGELQVYAWKPWPPRPMSPPYDWKVVLTLPRGGFIDAIGEFPFEAPETGYEQSYTIDMLADSGTGWKVSAERILYFTFGEPKKFGRLNVRTDGNSRYVFVDYLINPTGGRSLEDAAVAK
jgi:hypothetical protein